MVFENVLSGAFIYSLGAIAGKKSSPEQAVQDSLSFFQQTPSDKEVGDLLADWGGKSFIIEFKRSIRELRDELKKDGKIELGEEILRDEQAKANELSKKCHFLGYGKYKTTGAGEKNIDFVFQSYLSIITAQKGVEHSLNSFINILLDANSDIGITSKDEFGIYLDFLIKHAEKEAATSGTGGKEPKPIRGIVSIISPTGKIALIEYTGYNHLKYLMSRKINLTINLSEQIALEQPINELPKKNIGRGNKRGNGISM